MVVRGSGPQRRSILSGIRLAVGELPLTVKVAPGALWMTHHSDHRRLAAFTTPPEGTVTPVPADPRDHPDRERFRTLEPSQVSGLRVSPCMQHELKPYPMTGHAFPLSRRPRQYAPTTEESHAARSTIA